MYKLTVQHAFRKVIFLLHYTVRGDMCVLAMYNHMKEFYDYMKDLIKQ